MNVHDSSTLHWPLAVPGIRLGTAGAGIKRATGTMCWSSRLRRGGTSCAAVFTRNAFCAAPVTVAREHVTAQPRWLLINSGNANAGTGNRGLEDARQTCRLLAGRTGGDFRRSHALFHRGDR